MDSGTAFSGYEIKGGYAFATVAFGSRREDAIASAIALRDKVKRPVVFKCYKVTLIAFSSERPDSLEQKWLEGCAELHRRAVEERRIAHQVHTTTDLEFVNEALWCQREHEIVVGEKEKSDSLAFAATWGKLMQYEMAVNGKLLADIVLPTARLTRTIQPISPGYGTAVALLRDTWVHGRKLDTWFQANKAKLDEKHRVGEPAPDRPTLRGQMAGLWRCVAGKLHG